MGFDFKKSTTFRLTQAAKAQRARAGNHLSRIGLHPGQEAVLKVLSDSSGRTMSQLALALGVQPPTVTKMISRLATQGLVRRQMSEADGRLATVFLTEEGLERVKLVDKAWKKLEKEALSGLEDKERKVLRKLLRKMEKNLSPGGVEFDEDEADDEADDELGEERSAQVANAPLQLEEIA
ncbi:MarR family winged helix-turn-helix transcriptional regulator [Polycladidibacter hongkongensis]|uniref:MarR family winged helix-turn-helix transcriptional regulator n=1 Tax=Polycladidibacter hongkongensis TaxID=1647556 RepID=UPI00083739C1|nr:MarR family winged helix-turn-helix transcriptional regulator [Pseudovibrio hongkongensis]